jgi:hypothetical protein
VHITGPIVNGLCQNRFDVHHTRILTENSIALGD